MLFWDRSDLNRGFEPGLIQRAVICIIISLLCHGCASSLAVVPLYVKWVPFNRTLHSSAGGTQKLNMWQVVASEGPVVGCKISVHRSREGVAVAGVTET